MITASALIIYGTGHWQNYFQNYKLNTRGYTGHEETKIV